MPVFASTATAGYGSADVFTCRYNARPDAAAGPACVSGWMKKSFPPRAGELLRPLDSSPPQPALPGELAACLYYGAKGQNRGKHGRRKRNEMIVLM